MSKGIWRKRRKVLLKIAEFSAGNVVIGGAPKPGAEIPSHIALIATDMVMCAMIYEEYFSENISGHTIIEILGKAGILLVVAGGGGYAVAKSASGLIAEVTNFFGPHRLDYHGNSGSERNCLVGTSMDDSCRLGLS